MWEQCGGCGLEPNGRECTITVWHYTLKALKEDNLRLLNKRKIMSKQHGFRLLPTYDDDTVRDCITNMLVTLYVACTYHPYVKM